LIELHDAEELADVGDMAERAQQARDPFRGQAVIEIDNDIEGLACERRDFESIVDEVPVLVAAPRHVLELTDEDGLRMPIDPRLPG
jgi:hypothetical protein